MRDRNDLGCRLFTVVLRSDADPILDIVIVRDKYTTYGVDWLTVGKMAHSVLLSKRPCFLPKNVLSY